MRSLLVVVLVSLMGCTGYSPDTVTVYAASSLSDVFEELGGRFERRSKKDVEFNFAGSQTLRLQIEHGAPADVFASADERHVDALVAAGRVDRGRALVQNELVAIVPVESSIAVFEDLVHAERIVVGSQTVPVGAYTQRMLTELATSGSEELAEKLTTRIVSEENNVRMVRSKVALGVADAGFVYRTDAMGADAVRAIELPAALGQRAQYAIGLVDERSAAAVDFVEYVQSDEASEVFSRFGFRAAR